MRQIGFGVIFCAVFGAVLFCAAEAPRAVVALPADPARRSADEFFGLDKLWTIHIHLTAREWKELQPYEPLIPPQPGQKKPFFWKPTTQPAATQAAVKSAKTRPAATRPADRRAATQPRAGGNRAKTRPALVLATRPATNAATNPAPDAIMEFASKMGFEFKFAQAEMELEGRKYLVGMRFKGNSSYSMSRDALKRPVKIELNRLVGGQKLFGQTMLSLSNNIFDPTMVREAVSYAAMREAGVPSPRTAFVKVYLTVDGTHNRKYLGVYTIVEEVAKPFLKDRFGSSKGMLMKPDGMLGVLYLGEDWEKYEDRYHVKGDVTALHATRLIEFARFVKEVDDATFERRIGEYLDVDEFLRFIAANALTVNLDSFLSLGHNYYLYLDAKTNRFKFIPWDLNMAFGGFILAGNAERQSQVSIAHPHIGSIRIIDRMLEVKKFAATYREIFRTINSDKCGPAKLLAMVDLADRTIREAREQEVAQRPKRLFGGFEQVIRPAPELRWFIRKRAESISAQLAGKSAGWVPHYTGAFNFDPPERPETGPASRPVNGGTQQPSGGALQK